ncbi:acetylxylan esterase [Sphingobacterium sp. SYP-B4668]|uniref:acetylxylan esterase n=1 Tax=Sphingobacterium sp. SYP-B4668 TaxID=2996035 RepID=UPI0022DD878A|nr:acetylxylan esterase [Sphingobacterium sp. SYP-B4668]
MKNLFFLFFLLCFSHQLLGQPAKQLVEVLVAPQNADYLYKLGDEATFNITVLKNNVPVKDVEIRYDISEDMMKPSRSEVLSAKNGVITVKGGTLKKAGFLRCQVNATYEGNEYKGLATVGFEPEKIAPVAQLPDDFEQFWNQEKSKMSAIPLDVKMTLLPEKCTEKVNVYHVNVQNFESGSRVYGMLTVPKGEGKYPAILKVPGAGVRAYNGDVENASKGYIVLEIGIHGIPVNLPNEVYWNLAEGALKNYNTINLENRDQYYYKRVYLGCVRAIDFIFTLPEFDGTNLIAYGGSQGGALSIVTASLDKRVKGLVSFYPALCDMTGYLHGRAGGWPHMFNKEINNTPEKIKTSLYYDVVNFARHIQVPGYYGFGYNDLVCPPTTVYAALNTISGPKEYFIAEDTGHYTYPEQRTKSMEWISRFLQQTR